MKTRYDLDAVAARTPIDARWSARTRLLVGGASMLIAAGAVVGGLALAQSLTPPPLPKTPQEALALMSSERYASIDEGRRRQLAAEARRIILAMPEDERRSLMRDQANDKARRAIGEDWLDDAARRVARGEDVEMPFPRTGGPGQPGGPGPGAEPGDAASREARMAQMRQRMKDGMAQQLESGNAQSSGLRAEFFKGRMGPGGGGRGPRP